MSFTLYHSDSIGNKSNCLYPHAAEITDAESMLRAVSHDYVAVAYKNGYRSTENFLRADCLVLDCDNDHSDNPDEWIRPADLCATFPDVAFAVHYSRYHEKVKNGKTARPKFHCFFPIDQQTDPDAYKAMKQQLQTIFPFFDPNALDAARFFFGTENPQVELFAGDKTVSDILADDAFEAMEMANAGIMARINEGSRNSSMSHFAGRILKRYGDTPEAYEVFLTEAEKCDPPLEDQELQTIWRSALQFAKRVQQQDGYIPPEEYNADFQYCPDDFTDVGQAEVLSRVSGCELRYSPATDYICYNGTYWDESKHGAQGIAQKLTTNQLEEARKASERAWETLVRNGAAEIIAMYGKKKAETLFSREQSAAFTAYNRATTYQSFALKRRESKNITSTLKEARPMLAITPRELDADEFLLCTPDATYDLRKGIAGAMEHQPEHFMTKVTAISPGEKGNGIWKRQLNLVFCGDQELMDYVQLVSGLACIGKVFLEALIIAYGQGANGKSTFWNTISRVLGSYSGKVSADSLTIGCRRNVKPEMAELKGKRLVIAAELEEGTRLNTAIVKQMCSTDEVYAEKKYKDPFRFVPSHTLVLYTNHLPKVGAIDEGTWRRLIVVPFNARIVGKSDIKNYSDYLYDNAAEAILAWIIEGAKKVIDLDFKVPLPAVVEVATAIYREQNNWLAHFINERCETGDDYIAKSGEFYQAYRSYCAETSEFTRSTAEFYTALDNARFNRKHTKEGRFIYGVRLKNVDAAGLDDFLN